MLFGSRIKGTNSDLGNVVIYEWAIDFPASVPLCVIFPIVIGQSNTRPRKSISTAEIQFSISIFPDVILNGFLSHSTLTPRETEDSLSSTI